MLFISPSIYSKTCSASGSIFIAQAVQFQGFTPDCPFFMRLDSHSKSRGSGFGIDGHVAHLVDPDEKGVEQWVHPAACKGVGERLESGASEVHGLEAAD